MENIEYIIGDENTFKKISEIPAWKPFDDRVINFCTSLSSELIKDKICHKYPDLITLAFWLRKSNIEKIQNGYSNLTNNLGRGLVFHIAPGNVALSFAYSLITGLLTGNVNIIRLPSRKFEQSNIFCEILTKILKDKPEIAKRICMIKYPHDKEITDLISSKCQTRIIWGGDNTINNIRQSILPPRATEITFANRFSICLINADKYLSEYNPKKTAHDFYIDTYLTDQNACSSPRIICWYGKNIKEAKKIFWNALYNEISEYYIAEVTTVNKLLTYCKYASENECKMTTEQDYRIMRIQIDKLDKSVLENIGNSGYFYEYDMSDINEILPICTLELQTLSYLGFEPNKLQELILSNAPKGVDRIVPVGHTMDFNFIWDGRDIINEMTRKIPVETI